MDPPRQFKESGVNLSIGAGARARPLPSPRGGGIDGKAQRMGHGDIRRIAVTDIAQGASPDWGYERTGGQA